MIQKGVEDQPTVFVVDDDVALRDGVANLLLSVGMKVESYGSTAEFLGTKRSNAPGCLLLDVRLPGMSGLEFQSELEKLGIRIPIVFMTGHADVPMGVQAMKAGAVEFLCKPFREQDLLDAIRTAIERDRVQRTADASYSKIRTCYELLTPREQEVLAQIAQGKSNAAIAKSLVLTKRAVEKHINSIFLKLDLSESEDVSKRVKAALLFLAEERATAP